MFPLPGTNAPPCFVLCFKVSIEVQTFCLFPPCSAVQHLPVRRGGRERAVPDGAVRPHLPPVLPPQLAHLQQLVSALSGPLTNFTLPNSFIITLRE